jgi:hypothetical protein
LRDEVRNDIQAPIASGPGADPLTDLRANYAHAREENLRNVYVFYASTAGSLRKELLRTHDQAGAKVLTDFLAKIKPPGATAGAQPVGAKVVTK